MRMSYDRGTLLDRLFRKRNCTDPLLHLYKSGVLIETLSMSDIYRNALARSLFIRNTYDVKNGIVLIEGCNDSNFIYNFFAIQLAGYVPVPLPSDLWMEDQRHLEILRSIQTNCRSNLLIAGARTSEKVAGDFNDNECFDVLLDSDVGELSCLPVAVKGRDNDSNQSERIVLPVGDDLAHLQFSSGSTGLPKGVMISHSNLMANIRQIYESGRVIGAVCHGPVALLNVKLSNGNNLLKGKNINSFTEAEEVADKHLLGEIIPFMLDKELMNQGAVFSKTTPFEPYLVIDGNLVTGQNPASASGVAIEMMKLVTEK